MQRCLRGCEAQVAVSLHIADSLAAMLAEHRWVICDRPLNIRKLNQTQLCFRFPFSVDRFWSVFRFPRPGSFRAAQKAGRTAFLLQLEGASICIHVDRVFTGQAKLVFFLFRCKLRRDNLVRSSNRAIYFAIVFARLSSRQ